MMMRRMEIPAVAVCCVAVLVSSAHPGRGAEHRLGGMRPPTPEEQAYVDSVSTGVFSVQPNELSRRRAQAEALKAAAETPVPVRVLPVAVDNSTLPYFPPIGDQGAQGSCTAWAAGYYYSTFTQAMDGGHDVSGGDYDYICSPGFLYALINGGADNGAPISVATGRLTEIGCASWALQPYAEGDCTSWPSEAAWLEAIYNRTQDLYFVDPCTAEGLEALKQHLANGNLATTGFVAPSNFLQYPSDTTGINNGVWYAVDGDILGGHAVAIIGYDDNRAYTDHRDGQVHHGAFLLANSWGQDWGVQNSTGSGTKGFFWVAYALLLEHPEGMWERAWFCSDRPHYRPQLYAVVGINHAYRGQVLIWGRLGIPFDWSGYMPFWSDLDDPLPITDDKRVAIDFTDGIPTAPGGYPGWASVQINHYPEDPNSPVTVTSADFYSDLNGDGVYDMDSAIDVPRTLSSSTAWGSVSAIVSDAVPYYPDLPSAMEWEGRYQARVPFHNESEDTWTRADGYALQATGGLDRWGVVSVDLPGSVSVAPGRQYAFSFWLTGPPITTLRYATPVTPTSVGVVDTLACSWSMVQNGTPLHAPAALEDVEMSRFLDLQQGTAGAWARYHVEECAGRTPQIVGGYPDGTYRPAIPVSRAQMAVFIQRAADLPLGAYAGDFSDVAADHWAAEQIQSCLDAQIVGGYPDGTYRPLAVVNRDAMAVFMARALAKGDGSVPSGPLTARFSDVPTSYWAHRYIEYVASERVVGGYSDGTYRPTTPVSRDQMAVFVYRGFVQPTGAVVVLGGPAVTGVDPETASYQGWSSHTRGATSDPGYAYVVFDAVRLGTDLVYPQAPDGKWEVRFELRAATAPETPATGSYASTVSLTSADIESARSIALTTGIAHWTLWWRIPTGLMPGDYLLVVSATDKTGTRREITRRPAFAITP